MLQLTAGTDTGDGVRNVGKLAALHWVPMLQLTARTDTGKRVRKVGNRQLRTRFLCCSLPPGQTRGKRVRKGRKPAVMKRVLILQLIVRTDTVETDHNGMENRQLCTRFRCYFIL